jgi:hypothetical protein
MTVAQKKERENENERAEKGDRERERERERERNWQKMDKLYGNYFSSHILCISFKNLKTLTLRIPEYQIFFAIHG